MFGGGSSTPFGSPSGGFGSTNTASAFGSPAPAPFGAPAAPSGFGGGFGAPAPAPSGFGGFGAPAPAPTGGFGGFGAPAPAPSAFGSSGFGAAPSSSPFGAPAPATGGGMFGASPSPAPGGLFGSSPAPSTGGFGNPTSTFGGGGFGSSSTTPAFGGGSTFGAPAPAPTGLFGSSPSSGTGGFGASGFGSTPSAFGSPAPAPSTGLFGAPAPAPSTGMFGAPAPAAGGAGSGTKVQPYQVTNRADGTSSINLQAITAMPAYESKSFEELRLEDYSQGNRGEGGAPVGGGGFGGFGAPAPAPSGGLFGASAPAPAFGAPPPASGGFGGFGAPAPAPFGAPAQAPFGAPAPAPFGAPAPAAFGAPPPSTGAFGSSGAFGAQPPSSGGLFGAPAPSTGGGLFASSPSPAPGGFFGTQPAPAPGGFGSPAPSPGLFGAPAPASFGAPAPAPFGAPAPAAFGGFGAPASAPGGSLFGAPSSAFGAPSPGGSLFGAPSPSPGGGLFGAPAPATSGFFGAPPPAAPAPYGGFGAQAPSAFGAPQPPPAAAPAAPPPVGAVIPPASDEIIAAQIAALEQKTKEMQKSDSFRRKTSESSSVTGVSLSERDSMGSLTPARAPYSAYRASPKSNAKLRPRGFASPEKNQTPSLSRLGSGGKPMATPDTLAASSATRLVINPSPKPKLKLSLQSNQASSSPLKITNGGNPSEGLGHATTPGATPPTPAAVSTPGSLTTPNGKKASKGYEYYQQVVGSPSDEAAGTPERSNAAPKLTKDGYTCSPPIDVLSTLPAEDLAAVPNFAIERPGVGKIEWEGAVDIRGTDLDSVVIIEPKSASVYMKEEEENKKPAVGTKLNRSAVITLEDVFSPEATFESQDKFAKKVERQTKKMGAQLIDYDSTTGVWRLRVQHFSRYALDDDDDSSSEAEMGSVAPKVHFDSGERDGRSRVKGGGINRKATPYKPPKVLKSVAVVVEDEEDDKSSSDGDMDFDSKAEEAFVSLQASVKDHMETDRRRKEETDEFPEEAGRVSQAESPSRYTPTLEDLDVAGSKKDICSVIAQAAGVKKSSIDFGTRMGKSFRIGWSPDGSFMCRDKSGRLVRRRPKFVHEKSPSGCNISFLEQHQANAHRIGDNNNCPQFSFPSDDGLGKALASYVKDLSTENGGASMAESCFALLKCLGKATGDGMALLTDELSDSEESRRLSAVQQWLVDSCAGAVDVEVRKAVMKNQNYAALLSAISGGDIEKACSVADELGFHHLTSMLSAGPEGRSDILSCVMAWTDSGAASKMPDDLIRSYFVLGGDLKMEEDIFKRKCSPFDWQRRMAMSLVYGLKPSKMDLSSILTDYENKVAKGYAPYPTPRYIVGNSNDNVQCVLYRLLSLGRKEFEVPLRETVDPKGYAGSVHDFSLAFHLAAAISAMKCAAPLSEVEEEMLIGGYSSQLIAQGKWEWAVYVLLCQFSPGSCARSAWKQLRAKDVVLQHFTSSALGQRAFLEGMGIPPTWFEEALALRCATDGDEIGYLSHMVKVSPEGSSAVLEYTLVPNMFFMDRTALIQARNILDVFSMDASSLLGAVFDFFQIYEDVLRLEQSSRPEINEAVPPLLERCEHVERTLVSYQSGEANLQGPQLRILPGTKTVPMACFLAEGLSQISLIKLKLRALQSQMSISSTAAQILNLAQPSEMVDSGISARENILRWLM